MTDFMMILIVFGSVWISAAALFALAFAIGVMMK